MKDLITEIQDLLMIMQGQLHSKFEHTIETTKYHMEEGRNYIKLVRSEDGRDSVCGFIVKNPPKYIDNKTNKPFEIGDMLMAAGWNKPATNFARGNIFNYDESSIRWTGI